MAEIKQQKGMDIAGADSAIAKHRANLKEYEVLLAGAPMPNTAIADKREDLFVVVGALLSEASMTELAQPMAQLVILAEVLGIVQKLGVIPSVEFLDRFPELEESLAKALAQIDPGI